MAWKHVCMQAKHSWSLIMADPVAFARSMESIDIQWVRFAQAPLGRHEGEAALTAALAAAGKPLQREEKLCKQTAHSFQRSLVRLYYSPSGLPEVPWMWVPVDVCCCGACARCLSRKGKAEPPCADTRTLPYKPFAFDSEEFEGAWGEES